MKRMKNLLMSLLIASVLPAVAFTQTGNSMSATLTGAQEVPGPGDTDGSGLAVVTISGATVTYSLLVQNIAAPTLAHIHRAPVGVEGPIVVNFNPTFNGGLATASVQADAAIANEILGNPAGFYVNVHNAEFPVGAIRGQLVGAGGAGEGETTQFIPVVGKVTGVAGTNFVTDLRVINNGGAAATVTLDLFAASQAGQAGPTVTRTVTVNPSEQEVLDDLIGATLQTAGLGGLRITSPQPVTVNARIINDLRSMNLGTTGFAFQGLAIEDAATAGTLSFLSQASSADIATGVGFRTNIGYFNPNSTPVTATFAARRTTDGSVLGSTTVAVPGFSQFQQGGFQLLASVPIADQVQSNFYVTWTSTGPLFVYGSVVDNKTGDSVIVR